MPMVRMCRLTEIDIRPNISKQDMIKYRRLADQCKTVKDLEILRTKLPPNVAI